MTSLSIDKGWFARACRDPRARRALAIVCVLLIALGLWFWLGRGDDALGGGDEADRPSRPTGPRTDALIIRSIDVDAPMLTIQMDDGVLTPPSDVDAVGWWDGSAKPGAPTGRTIVTGHTVHDGGGVLNRLDEVDRGDLITVRRNGKLLRFTATRVETYSREYVDTNAVDLMGQTDDRNQLVLITCADWVDGEYESNVFVYASPRRSARP